MSSVTALHKSLFANELIFRMQSKPSEKGIQVSLQTSEPCHYLPAQHILACVEMPMPVIFILVEFINEQNQWEIDSGNLT